MRMKRMGTEMKMMRMKRMRRRMKMMSWMRMKIKMGTKRVRMGMKMQRMRMVRMRMKLRMTRPSRTRMRKMRPVRPQQHIPKTQRWGLRFWGPLPALRTIPPPQIRAVSRPTPPNLRPPR